MCYVLNNGPCSICGRLSNPMIEGSGCNCAIEKTYMNNRCNICGEKNTLTEPCNCNKPGISFQDLADKYGPRIDTKPGIITTSTSTEEPTSTNKELRELYNELGKMSWIGGDKGWDEAIDAVRAYVREQ